MDKSLAMAIKETKSKLANVCNESGLPIAILDLIVQGVYYEIHSLVEKQVFDEEKSYMKPAQDNEG